MARAIVGAADAIAQKDESDRKMRQAVLDALKEVVTAYENLTKSKEIG